MERLVLMYKQKNSIYLFWILLTCIAILIPFFPCEKGHAKDYDTLPAHSEEFTIVNSTLTDVAFELFTAEKWGKVIVNITWDGNQSTGGDELNILLKLWTVTLNETYQDAYGDIGQIWITDNDDFPLIKSYECEYLTLHAEELPITISYEIDTTNNQLHEMTNETTLTINLDYYILLGEYATRTRDSKFGIESIVLAFSFLSTIIHRRFTQKPHYSLIIKES